MYELQGSSERALAARHQAAEGFAHVGQDADAAAELLAAVSHLEAMGSLTPALEIVEHAAMHAERAQRRDLVARARGSSTALGAGPRRTYEELDELVTDVENARVWGGLHYRTTMTKTARHFPRIARDVGRQHFLIDAGRSGDNDNEDEDDD